MSEAFYKGVTVLTRIRELENGNFTGDFTLVEHRGPETVETPYTTDREFPDRDTAKQAALEEARMFIDRTGA